MGKPTGFLEYQRVETRHRAPSERVRDYEEFLLTPGDEELHLQSARCMDCGVPFCHAAFVVEGRTIGCPLSNLIPEINDLVYRGEMEAAWRRLSMTNPFPEITGRVCPALCEGSCTVGEYGDPVTVHDIERVVADWARHQGLLVPRKPAMSTGRRVAVVGSGPAGLACADQLNRLGDAVTVFERDDRPGGFLMYGIPAMKLDKSLVLDRVRLLEEEGVTFRLSTEVGADYAAIDLLREFDAVVLCGGARKPRAITAPGSDVDGVIQAVDYLTGATRQLLDGGEREASSSARDRDVIVVGGGDTGTDCVATAIRQGARSVTQLEILPEPATERPAHNPWPLWPDIKRTGYGHEEAKAVFGGDPREYSVTVKEIHGREGRVSGVTTVQVEWEIRDGRRVPVEIPGTEKTRQASLVLTAMGFTGPEDLLPEQLDLATDARGNVAAEEHRTNLASVFVAGDMRRGPSLVVWAIREGRRAAEACHNYLEER